MRVTLSLIHPEFPYKGQDGVDNHPLIPAGKKFLIIKNLDERLSLTIQFFPTEGSDMDARYSVNTDMVLPLHNNYKTFSIMLDKFITPEHSISFDVEFE